MIKLPLTQTITGVIFVMTTLVTVMMKTTADFHGLLTILMAGMVTPLTAAASTILFLTQTITSMD